MKKSNSVAKKTLKIVLPLVLLLSIFIPDLAFASAAPWESAATKIKDIMSGGLARTVATIAVMWLGYSYFTGRIEAGTAIKVGAGIIIIFSAPAIVNMLATASGG